ncbi:MAG TPA: hypothetical protein VGF99_19510 [Myxococcota bacterium]
MHDDAPHSARPSIDAPTTSAVAVSSPSPEHAVLQGALHDDEQIIWQGAPNPSRRFWAWAYMIVVGSVCTGWGLLLLGYAIPKMQTSTVSDFAVLWLWFLALWTVGAFVTIVLRPWYERQVATHTVYAITNRRLLVVERRFDGPRLSWKCQAFGPRILERRRGRTGGGAIVFETIRKRSGKGSTTVELGFLDIDDLDAVEAIIHRTFGTTGATP